MSRAQSAGAGGALSDPFSTLHKMDATPHMDSSAHARPPPEMILHPDGVALARRRDELRTELGALLERVDRCQLVEVPWARALYDEKMGRLELAHLQLRARNASLRRRLAMLIARRNRGELVTPEVLEGIAAQVERDLDAWWQEVREKERQLREGHSWLAAGPGDPMRAAVARRLYRELCRALHPDATGGETEEYARHWRTVQTAYKEQDVEVLRAVDSLLRKGQHDSAPQSAGDLLEECDRLEARIRAQLERLEGLQKSPPLSLRALLEDPAQVAQKQAAIRASIEAEEKSGSELELAMAALGGATWARA